MKILSLDLIAYGPFTNKSLQFPDGGANLHIVYGPNEAGKSCALRALSNALYGIPLDQKDGFLHPYEDLRIGLTVEAGGGPVGVVRRKGRASSLRRNDGTDSVFPAAEWAALLPVEERELFDRMFGVDHAAVAMGGKLILSLALGRFTRILGTLLANGIPILRSLEIAKDSTGNKVLAQAIHEAAENITAGQKLAAPLRRCKYFPTDVVEMIAVAEESNSLEKVLVDIANALEKRSARQLELFVKLLEPVMLLFMAAIVLVVVMGLLLPVFKMGSAVG